MVKTVKYLLILACKASLETSKVGFKNTQP
jgi:hypothetical protein